MQSRGWKKRGQPKCSEAENGCVRCNGKSKAAHDTLQVPIRLLYCTLFVEEE